MSFRVWFASGLLAVLIVSCGGGGGGIVTPEETREDWAFPTDSTAFAVRLFSPASQVATGDLFEVRLALYNVNDVFGAAVEVGIDTARVEVRDIVPGPFLSPVADALYLVRNDRENARISFGGTYRAGSGRLSSGSGVLFKLKCRARASGPAKFRFRTHPDLRTRTGTEIPMLHRLARDELTLEVR